MKRRVGNHCSVNRRVLVQEQNGVLPTFRKQWSSHTTPASPSFALAELYRNPMWHSQFREGPKKLVEGLENFKISSCADSLSANLFSGKILIIFAVQKSVFFSQYNWSYSNILFYKINSGSILLDLTRCFCWYQLLSSTKLQMVLAQMKS